VFIPKRRWIVAKRERDEAFFLEHYQQIRRAAWVLSHMPFVRGIFLTGRTSKGVLSESDDFDFLIVTEEGRARLTWILLFLFRRLVSLNFRNANFKWFCCNYVLAQDQLTLTDRDVFIAMELACAFPVFNRPLFEKFRQANEWRRQYFQQRGSSLPDDLSVTFRFGLVQRLLEVPCNLFWAAPVRRWVENYYRRRWLKLGIVKDENDYRQKASDAYVKPDTGGRRKFIVERVERLEPLEHQSFLRTKTNLHRALTHNGDTPDILLTHARLAPLNKQAPTHTRIANTSPLPEPALGHPSARSVWSAWSLLPLSLKAPAPKAFGGRNSKRFARFHSPGDIARASTGPENPDPFLKGSSGALRAAEFLRKHGYRAERYDHTAGPSVTEIFRCVKTRLIPLVGIYVQETARADALRMIELFHGVGARIIVAGPDAANHPQLYLDREADIVITGQGEPELLAVLEHIHKGNVALEAIEGICYPGKTGNPASSPLPCPPEEEVCV